MDAWAVDGNESDGGDQERALSVAGRFLRDSHKRVAEVTPLATLPRSSASSTRPVSSDYIFLSLSPPSLPHNMPTIDDYLTKQIYIDKSVVSRSPRPKVFHRLDHPTTQGHVPVAQPPIWHPCQCCEEVRQALEDLQPGY